MNADPIKLGRETLPEATRNALISTHKHSSLSFIFWLQRKKLKNRLPQLIINKSVGRRKERGDDETWGVAHNTWACDSCVVKCRNADTYINESRVISFLDVVQDWSFIEKGQHGHVFHLVKFGWFIFCRSSFGMWQRLPVSMISTSTSSSLSPLMEAETYPKFSFGIQTSIFWVHSSGSVSAIVRYDW